MDNSEPIQLNIEVSDSDAVPEEIYGMTRQLFLALREEKEVKSVKLANGGPPPDGAKGDPITIGSLVLEALPTILPTLVAMFQAWSSLAPGRIVKFKCKEFEFEGSPKEFRQLLEKRERRKKKK